MFFYINLNGHSSINSNDQFSLHNKTHNKKIITFLIILLYLFEKFNQIFVLSIDELKDITAFARDFYKNTDLFKGLINRNFEFNKNLKVNIDTQSIINNDIIKFLKIFSHTHYYVIVSLNNSYKNFNNAFDLLKSEDFFIYSKQIMNQIVKDFKKLVKKLIQKINCKFSSYSKLLRGGNDFIFENSIFTYINEEILQLKIVAGTEPLSTLIVGESSNFNGYFFIYNSLKILKYSKLNSFFNIDDISSKSVKLLTDIDFYNFFQYFSSNDKITEKIFKLIPEFERLKWFAILRFIESYLPEKLRTQYYEKFYIFKYIIEKSVNDFLKTYNKSDIKSESYDFNLYDRCKDFIFFCTAASLEKCRIDFINQFLEFIAKNNKTFLNLEKIYVKLVYNNKIDQLVFRIKYCNNLISTINNLTNNIFNNIIHYGELLYITVYFMPKFKQFSLFKSEEEIKILKFSEVINYIQSKYGYKSIRIL